MSFFDCRLRIGYKAKDNKTPIVDQNGDTVLWANLNAVQRTNLLGALQAKVKEAFPGKDPSNDDAFYFDLWQHRMIEIGDGLPTNEVQDVLRSYLNKRLDEAAGNDVFKTDNAASHVEYTHYDNKIICEHYFKVLNENGTDWEIQNVPFDSGGAATWVVSANLVELGIRFNQA